MTVRQLLAFLVPAIAVIALCVNAVNVSFDSLRLAPVLAALCALQLALWPRFRIYRELRLYLAFGIYMLVSLLWAPDPAQGANTLYPALDCVIALILFGSLAANCDTRTVLTGLLCGALVSSFGYSLITRFPFDYPEGFSYNAVASMYLFSFAATLLFGATGRSKLIPLVIACVLLLCIGATSSIKTNLGIALGAFSALLFYFKHSVRLLWRTALALIAVIGMVGYVVVSNDSVAQRLAAGLGRVALGATVLASSDDAPNSVGLGLTTRENWKDAGIRGWLHSPVLGNGVEALRADIGITSHSTPIDLLYNTGIIGLALFYACLGSVAWRLVLTRHTLSVALRAAILLLLTCYSFTSLSGIMHYNVLLAAFIALSSQLLERAAQPGTAAAVVSMQASA